MKKTFLYVCVIAMLAMILPSCLGDNESTIQGTREFAVVNEDATSHVKYVRVGGGAYVTWDGISAYGKGDAMLLTYKISSSNVNSAGIIMADYASVVEGESFPVSVQKDLRSQSIDTTKQANTAFFKNFNVNVDFANSVLYLDRGLFSYTAGVKDGQVLTANFYYDATKQTQKDGTALPANTAIVDVFLTKSGTAIDGATTKTPNVMIVTNFESLRNTLRPSSTSEDVFKSIWLRLRIENSTDASKYTWTEMRNAGILYYPKS